MADVIAAEHLTKSYGRKRRRGVVDLDFAVPPGQVFGYLGPNGAGKTTTIRMLAALIEPTSGEATVAGCRLGKDDRRLRGQVVIPDVMVHGAEFPDLAAIIQPQRDQ